MVRDARKRAKKYGIPVNITIADIKIPKRCPILGMELRVQSGSQAAAHSPSLDRIIPKKGYVRGNIIVISQKANQIKTNATVAEIGKVWRFYRRLLAQKTSH